MLQIITVPVQTVQDLRYLRCVELFCEQLFFKFIFQLILHSPNEIPKVKDYGIAISYGVEKSIVIKPLIITTSAALQSIPIDLRQCVMPNEYSLKYFR